VNLIDLDDPWDHIDLHEIMATTDDPAEVDNLVHLKWCGIEYRGQILVVIGYQEVDDDTVSVSGWMMSELGKTFLVRRIFAAWMDFLQKMRDEGYDWVFASTLKTNESGIRFNEHAGYERTSEDETTIYWIKEL